jgi:hypothetical protein
MGTAKEMGRLIRLSYNGHLAVSELTGYVFALDKTRACLESALAIEAAQQAAAATQAQADAKAAPMAITILTVPEGHYHQPDGSFAPMSAEMQLRLEHTPSSERGIEESASRDDPEPRAGCDVVSLNSRRQIDQEFTPQTERERRLLAELESLSPEELLERAKQAGYVDVDSV